MTLLKWSLLLALILSVNANAFMCKNASDQKQIEDSRNIFSAKIVSTEMKTATVEIKKIYKGSLSNKSKLYFQGHSTVGYSFPKKLKIGEEYFFAITGQSGPERDQLLVSLCDSLMPITEAQKKIEMIERSLQPPDKK